MITLLLVLLSQTAAADDEERLAIAVASNFAPTLRAVLEDHPLPGKIRADISAGSTGRLYAQIINGAPYDVFLAADTARPQRLADAGLTLDDTVYVYATGQLVLWGPLEHSGAASCREALAHKDTRLAMANPRVAPYGDAARRTLESLGLWPLPRSPALAENVGQAHAFLDSGNVRLAFLAASQLPPRPSGCVWTVEAQHHQALSQGAAILTRTKRATAARTVIDHLISQPVQEALTVLGYAAP